MSNNRFLRLPLTAAGTFLCRWQLPRFILRTSHATRVAPYIALKLSQRTVDAFELEWDLRLQWAAPQLQRRLGNAAFSYRRSVSQGHRPSVCTISARERGHRTISVSTNCCHRIASRVCFTHAAVTQLRKPDCAGCYRVDWPTATLDADLHVLEQHNKQDVDGWDPDAEAAGSAFRPAMTFL